MTNLLIFVVFLALKLECKSNEIPKVYFTKNITPNSLVKLFDILGKNLPENVAIKIHSGEHDKTHILQPEFIEPLVTKLKGTIIETNTLYEGNRFKTEDHLKLLERHGFKPKFNCDILDSEGDMNITVQNGKHIEHNLVGKGLDNYKSILVLSHFKGHQMGGFGGAIKNVAIGIASSKGKAFVHGAGNATDPFNTEQLSFLETLAEAAKSVKDYMKDNMAYINVMKDLSIDCDCSSNPHDPEMRDIGILSSLDPVALDAACVELIYKSEDKGKISLIKRIEEKKGTHTLEYAEQIGLGTRQYELINLDENNGKDI